MRPYGVKFSARTSRRRIHCGNLLNDILTPYGSGGGHASMAGGFAAYDKLPDLCSEKNISAIEYLVEHTVLNYIKKQYE